jgi:DNA-binding transcriptional regulator/RsmH inhibitor MraZ
MLLPESLKRAIDLEDKVVFAGVGERVELWRPDIWDRLAADSLATYEDQARDVFVAKQASGTGGSSPDGGKTAS